MVKFLRRKAWRRSRVKQGGTYRPMIEQASEFEADIPLSFLRLLLGEQRLADYLKASTEDAPGVSYV